MGQYLVGRLGRLLVVELDKYGWQDDGSVATSDLFPHFVDLHVQFTQPSPSPPNGVYATKEIADWSVIWSSLDRDPLGGNGASHIRNVCRESIRMLVLLVILISLFRVPFLVDLCICLVRDGVFVLISVKSLQVNRRSR